MLEILTAGRSTYDSDHTLYPFTTAFEKKQATDILFEGEPIDPTAPLIVLFNSYHSKSGARRMMKLHEIVYSESAKRIPLEIDTIDTLIEHFLGS